MEPDLREVDETERRMFDFGSPCLAIDSDPYLERVLGCKAMKAEGRQETDNTPGYPSSGLCEVLMFRSGHFWKDVQPAAHPLDDSSIDQAPDLGSADPGFFQFLRAGDAYTPKEVLSPDCGCH